MTDPSCRAASRLLELDIDLVLEGLDLSLLVAVDRDPKSLEDVVKLCNYSPC
jgi:hypothetical protein